MANNDNGDEDIARAMNVEQRHVRIKCAAKSDINKYTSSETTTNDRIRLRTTLEKDLNLEIRKTDVLNKPYIATVEVPIEVFCSEFGGTGATYAVLEVIEFELDPASDKGWWKGSSVSYKRVDVADSHPKEIPQGSRLPPRMNYKDWYFERTGWIRLFKSLSEIQ